MLSESDGERVQLARLSSLLGNKQYLCGKMVVLNAKTIELLQSLSVVLICEDFSKKE